MFKTLFIKLNVPWIIDQYSDPPLGILSVMASAKDLTYNGQPLELRLLDMAHEKEIPKADLYAISACTPNYPELLKVAQEIKQNYDATVAVGGPHFDAMRPEKWRAEIDNLPIDVILKGEGEYTFKRLLSYLESSGNRPEKRVMTQDGKLLRSDELPIPAREFLDRNFYFKPGTVFAGDTTRSGNSATVMTSRGCPFECGFCASPELHDRKVRYRSVENVKQEIEMLKRDYNVTDIRFQDDCFTLNKKRFKDLANMLTEADIKYRCSMRADQVDKESMDLLWNSGCREIGIGVESAENEVLKLLVKGTNVDQNIYALNSLKERGFKVRAFMMTGLPGETKDSARHMIDFLEKTRPDVVTLTSFMPLPGSDVYNNPSDYGITIDGEDWLKYNMALTRDERTPFVHRLSTATLEEMEVNREMLKEYLFNNSISNVSKFNQPYRSSLLHKE